MSRDVMLYLWSSGGEQLISASDHDETADLEVGRLDDRLFNYEMQIFRAEPTHTLVSL